VGGTFCTKGEKGNVYRLLVGKPEGKRPLGRPRRRWIDNIKMDLLEIGWCCGLDWYGPGYVEMESSCELANELSGFIKMLRIYRVAAELAASRVVLSSTELVSYYIQSHDRRLNLTRNNKEHAYLA
jgi:hypothetical protein